jgi:hypothetical protein
VIYLTFKTVSARAEAAFAPRTAGEKLLYRSLPLMSSFKHRVRPIALSDGRRGERGPALDSLVDPLCDIPTSYVAHGLV